MRMGRVAGTALMAAATLVHAPVKAQSVAAFPPVPEEGAQPPAAAPAPPATPPPVGVAALPPLEPEPARVAPAPPAPVAAPAAPVFPPPASSSPPVSSPPLLAPTAPAFATPPAVAPVPPAPSALPARRPDVLAEHDQAQEDERTSKQWMVAIEAFTRAPLDMGVQAGLEFPYGVRFAAGYGWVPQPYLSFLTESVAVSAGVSSNATALLREGLQGGNTFRLQGGIRPFESLGFYLDAGYAHVSLHGSLSGSSLTGVGSGDYTADASIGMWLVELGYQAWIGRHFTLAGALGVTGTLSSTTKLDGPGVDPEVAADIARSVDEQIEQYGTLPTLTLRLGFDVI